VPLSPTSCVTIRRRHGSKRDPIQPLDDEFTDDLLELYGGWVLLIVGVALITLAFVFRGDATVAPTALVLGVLCVVFSVILARTKEP
jgi:hypothetical protein